MSPSCNAPNPYWATNIEIGAAPLPFSLVAEGGSARSAETDEHLCLLSRTIGLQMRSCVMGALGMATSFRITATRTIFAGLPHPDTAAAPPGLLRHVGNGHRPLQRQMGGLGLCLALKHFGTAGDLAAARLVDRRRADRRATGWPPWRRDDRAGGVGAAGTGDALEGPPAAECLMTIGRFEPFSRRGAYRSCFRRRQSSSSCSSVR